MKGLIFNATEFATSISEAADEVIITTITNEAELTARFPIQDVWDAIVQHMAGYDIQALLDNGVGLGLARRAIQSREALKYADTAVEIITRSSAK